MLDNATTIDVHPDIHFKGTFTYAVKVENGLREGHGRLIRVGPAQHCEVGGSAAEEAPLVYVVRRAWRFRDHLRVCHGRRCEACRGRGTAPERERAEGEKGA
jgi:hypothetical protein